MKTINYMIKTPVGLHSRHAGLLVKEASRYRSNVTVSKGGRAANGKAILGLMKLGVRQGDLIDVTVNGPDESVAAARLQKFLWTNF